MNQHTSIDAVIRAIVREELAVAGLVLSAAPPAPAAPLRALVAGWALLCVYGGTPAFTAHDVVARLYPAPSAPDRWQALREAVEHYAPPREPGATPMPAQLGEALRRQVKGTPVRTEPDAGLVRLVPLRLADGRPSRSGGRARWCVEQVPAYVHGSAAAARAALVARLEAESGALPPAAGP